MVKGSTRFLNRERRPIQARSFQNVVKSQRLGKKKAARGISPSTRLPVSGGKNPARAKPRRAERREKAVKREQRGFAAAPG